MFDRCRAVALATSTVRSRQNRACSSAARRFAVPLVEPGLLWLYLRARVSEIPYCPVQLKLGAILLLAASQLLLELVTLALLLINRGRMLVRDEAR